MNPLLLLLFALPLAAQPVTRLDRAFDRMYRNDFTGAQNLLDQHVRENPNDPVGYSVRSAAYLFAELDRLMIIESEFFNDDKRIIEKKQLKPDPKARSGVFDSVAKAREIAMRQLAANPKDKFALFALCIAAGIQTDYMALIEKRQLGSLSLAKESQAYAVRLLAVDPSFHDARLTTGVSEYLLGSVPFFVRWFVKFDQTQGSKTVAITNLELVATKGHYFRPFAKVLLAVIHLREKRRDMSIKLLDELHTEFPENGLFRRELDKLRNAKTK
jgi:hypothetical protein